VTLTIIVQTRNRPAVLRETLVRTLPAIERDDTTVLLCVDDDDYATRNILDTLPNDPRLQVSVRPREDTRGPKYDRALIEAPADVYLPTTDKVPITRKGFDTAILEAAALFPEGIGCVASPLINASFPGLQAPTAKLVEMMGYIYPPHFPFWFIDHWLDDVCRMIGRYITVDMGSQHNLLQVQGTIGLRDLVFWTSYFDALMPERQEQARRIINVLDEPAWRKTALLSNFQTVEYRSQWINDTVRASAAQIEANSSEGGLWDGYLRALKKAVEHCLELTEPAKEVA
jgi:hypothetical protein